MSQSIPLNTVLGERYKVTASVVETSEGDAVLEGKDQVLNRKVSIVVAAPVNNQRLISNARALATANRATIQILDLGNSDGRTYLITSFTRADALLDRLLADPSTIKADSETKEALGEEIFGDTNTPTSPVSYRKVRQAEAAQPVISASRELEDDEPAAEPAFAAGSATEVEEPAYDPEYDYEDEYEDEEEGRSSGSPWIIALAAVILLMIGAAAVYSSLNGMIDKNQASEQKPAATKSAEASASPAKPAAEESSAAPAKKVNPKFTSVSRIVPANPVFMADQDVTLGQMIDGSDATQWMTYGFGSANFGGLVDSFSLSYQLQEATKVSNLTIKQVSGTGGSFTVLTNKTNSLEGAVEVGSGSFTGETVNVKLDTGKQAAETKYVIVRFNSAPTLSQPIVPGFVFGARISEVTASN